MSSFERRGLAMNIRVQESLSTYFRRRKHTVLLIAMVVAFAARLLLGDTGDAPIVFSLALLALMLVALYTVYVDELVGERDVLLARRRRQTIVGWVLATLATGMSENVFINVKSRLHTITADVEIPKNGANGVILAQAGRFGGWTLYVKDGKPTYTSNWLGLQRYPVAAKQALPAGKAIIRFRALGTCGV